MTNPNDVGYWQRRAIFAERQVVALKKELAAKPDPLPIDDGMSYDEGYDDGYSDAIHDNVRSFDED